MEPGPVPPHERSWRHPSELGPTRADVAEPRGGVLAALTVGSLCVVAIGAMVVAMSPSPASDPVAVSATTAPPTRTLLSTSAPAARSVSATGISAAQLPARALLTSFAAFPHAITSGPELSLDGAAVATTEPAPTEPVFVRTEAVTYEVPWSSAEMVAVADGTVVFDQRGALVAHVVGGELVTIVDD